MNNNEQNVPWREKVTVNAARMLLYISFIFVIIMFLYTIYVNNVTMGDKILSMLNAFIMAVLGYLFGYVPTKASEESIKKEKEVVGYQLGEIEDAVADYKKVIAIKERKLKIYENMISLYETP